MPHPLIPPPLVFTVNFLAVLGLWAIIAAAQLR